jgi:transketolase
MNTGALGHGLPICVGLAIAGKLDEAGYRVFTLLGDGEMAEGSNWEAAMAAAHYKLDNLTAILDHNTLQITGHTREVCSNEPIDEKFASFGWHVRIVNGHNIGELTEALTSRPERGRPTLVIANTIKGRGVSFMENVVSWHHGVPTSEQFELAQSELVAAERALTGEVP